MLITKNPTASTVKYIVTTRPQSLTFAGHARRLLQLLARAIGIVVVLFILTWQYGQVTGQQTGLQRWLKDAMPAVVAALLSKEYSALNHLCITALCIGIIWLVFHKRHIEESLLVIRGLGVQTSTSSSSYLSTSSTRFIPTTAIQDIFIYEAFIGFKTRFYLSIVVENEDKVVVIFPKLLPSLDALELVWRGARACLYGDNT